MSNSTTETRNLIEAHAHGDPHAFSKLLDHYQGDLWGYLVNHMHRRQDAEDLYQDIMVRALNKMGTLRDPGKFRSWLFAIAINAVRSFFRRRPMVSLDHDEKGDYLLPPNPSANPNPHVQLEKQEQLKHLRLAMRHLPERDRQILLLDTMAELPQQEIADQLNLNLNTVKTIIRRAKIKLASFMVEVAHGK